MTPSKLSFILLLCLSVIFDQICISCCNVAKEEVDGNVRLHSVEENSDRDVNTFNTMNEDVTQVHTKTSDEIENAATDEVQDSINDQTQVDHARIEDVINVEESAKAVDKWNDDVEGYGDDVANEMKENMNSHLSEKNHETDIDNAINSEYQAFEGNAQSEAVQPKDMQEDIVTNHDARSCKNMKYSCISWIGELYKNLSISKVSKCPIYDDVMELLSYPVALIGDEYAYKKFITKTIQREDLVDRQPEFTIATWLYLTKRCSNEMCPLLYRMKGTAFQTPLIGLLRSGHLHIQVHYEDESGSAFLVDAQVPIHTWVHIAVTMRKTHVYVYVRHGRKLQHFKSFVHTDFPPEGFHYDDMTGYWGLGGSPGFVSTHGFIGPARIYRKLALSEVAIKDTFPAKWKPNLPFGQHFRFCQEIKSAVKYRRRKESKGSGFCSPNKLFFSRKESSCKAGVNDIVSEIIRVFPSLYGNKSRSNIFLPQKFYDVAFKLIQTNEDKVNDVIPLLLYSSCVRHQQSLYLLSTLYRVGVGLTVNTLLAQKYLLLGAYYNHPLSQMSLAYKHYIGADDLPKDHDVASTYYRYSAVQTNRILVEHNEVDTHSEAVRLDKREDLDKYRGPKSDWFSWLKHQATRGALDAQSMLGEVFYYGSRGFRRNLTKAAEFYEMGANRGDAQMLFNLGVVKLRGQGVDENPQEAQDLLRKSAELGFAPAYNALGYYEYNVRQNNSRAVEYFKRAAQMEDRDGLYNLGFAVENGLDPGTTGDIKSAITYYISAANKGHPGACVIAGDSFSLGEHVERDVKISVIFHKFVADQNPEIGFLLRNGLDGYFESSWYRSLFNYLLAAEAGVEVAQYNAALLCEWDWERVSRKTQTDCAWRYYNHSASLEWVPSLIKTADNYWYGIKGKKNLTTATELYSLAATKEHNPQAIYNLGYLVENYYPLEGLDWMEFHSSDVNPGNLTLAAAFYRKCRDTSEEALVPCSIGLVRVAIKMLLQLELIRIEVLFIPLVLFTFILAVLYYLCRLNADYQTINLA